MDSRVPCLSNGNRDHTNLRAKPGTVELFASDKAVPRAKIKNIERSTEISNPQQNKTLQSLASNKKFSSMRRHRTPPDTE